MPEDFQVTAARIGEYAAADGPCTCGERRGHAGWLICALSPEAGRNVAVTLIEGGAWGGAKVRPILDA